MKRLLIILLSLAILGCSSAGAFADSAPVGPLPAGPTATIKVQHGELVAIALPKRSTGRVWRIARRFDSKVLRQVSEAAVGSSIVLVFRAGSVGRTTVSLALTMGDNSGKALESRLFRFEVH